MFYHLWGREQNLYQGLYQPNASIWRKQLHWESINGTRVCDGSMPKYWITHINNYQCKNLRKFYHSLVDGAWTVWTVNGACSATCEGTLTKTRLAFFKKKQRNKACISILLNAGIALTLPQNMEVMIVLAVDRCKRIVESLVQVCFKESYNIYIIYC